MQGREFPDDFRLLGHVVFHFGLGFGEVVQGKAHRAGHFLIAVVEVVIAPAMEEVVQVVVNEAAEVTEVGFESLICLSSAWAKQVKLRKMRQRKCFMVALSCRAWR